MLRQKNYLKTGLTLLLISSIIGCNKEVLENDLNTQTQFENIDSVKTAKIKYLGAEANVIDAGDYYIFQGDIFLDKTDFETNNENEELKSTNTSEKSAAAVVDGNSWHLSEVYYTISSDLDDPIRVTYAINDIEANTNIRFIQRTNQTDYIKIINSDDSSYSNSIGKKGGEQIIGLRTTAAYRVMIHEFLHALGMFHEQSRVDRDNWVLIDYEAIGNDPTDIFQYDTYIQNGYRGFDHGVFDFDSIMLYWSTKGDNGNFKITTLNGNTIQENLVLSAGDISALNDVYKEVVRSSGSQSSNTKLSFADVNGDGKADKIYWLYSHNSGNIQVYLATSNGNFSSTPISSSGSQSSSTELSFADVNGDGKADKIYWLYSHNSGNIQVYLATSNGNFSSTPVSSSGSQSSSTELSFADVNGDGKADKIYWLYSHNGGNIQIYLATSNGNFSSIPISSSGSQSSSTELSFADVNGDGKADKIYWLYSHNGGNIQVYLATTNGNFSSTPISSSGSQSSSTKLYFADVNGDGKADKNYWLHSNNSGDIEVYLATSNGNFESEISEQVIGSIINTTRMYYADFNNDGKSDRVYWNYTQNNGDVLVYLAN